MSEPQPIRKLIPEVLELRGVKVLPTLLDGIYFRSRTEARWAKFFREIGLTYEYEKEGFDLGPVCYLPDFWLPQMQCWFEVKGDEPTEMESRKAQWLAEQTQRQVFLFNGGLRTPDTTDGQVFFS